MDQNGMSNSHRGPSIDASYHVSVHLAKLFQRRRFLEINQSETRIVCGGRCFLPSFGNGFRGEESKKSTNQKQESPVEAMFVILYKGCSFCSDPLTNMATTGNSCFSLVNF
jgi:hypothetical protein